MNERTLTPVQNAILNLAVETNYDASDVSEATVNETFSDIVANHSTYNQIFKPMTLREKAEWFSNAGREARDKAKYWSDRLTLKTASKYPKWRTNMEFWTKQAKYYEEQCDKLYKLIDSLVQCNG